MAGKQEALESVYEAVVAATKRVAIGTNEPHEALVLSGLAELVTVLKPNGSDPVSLPTAS